MECGLILGVASSGSTGTFGAAAAAWAASVAVPASIAVPASAGAATLFGIGFGMALGVGSLVAAPLVAGLWLLQGTFPAMPESGCPRGKKPKRHPVQQKLKNMKTRKLHGTQVRQKPKGRLPRGPAHDLLGQSDQSKPVVAPTALSKFLMRVGPSKPQVGQPNVTPTLVHAAWQQCEAKTAGAGSSTSSRDGALADTSLTGLPVLGQGRFGRVYLSRLESGQPCAVKVVANTSATAREVQCMKAIGGHDGVVKLFHHFHGNVDVAAVLLVLEYCNGGDLVGQPFSGNALASLTHQLMRAVNHVHGHGYIHRDIKQENILLCLPDLSEKNGFVVKLADFGCAALREDCIAPAGTRRIMAPELLLLCQAPCFKSDMWSAGYVYVLYAAVAGALPPCCLELVQDGRSAVPALKEQHRQEGNLFCDFLDGLLQQDRFARMSAEVALQHPYMPPSSPS